MAGAENSQKFRSEKQRKFIFYYSYLNASSPKRFTQLNKFDFNLLPSNSDYPPPPPHPLWWTGEFGLNGQTGLITRSDSWHAPTSADVVTTGNGLESGKQPVSKGLHRALGERTPVSKQPLLWSLSAASASAAVPQTWPLCVTWYPDEIFLGWICPS